MVLGHLYVIRAHSIRCLLVFQPLLLSQIRGHSFRGLLVFQPRLLSQLPSPYHRSHVVGYEMDRHVVVFPAANIWFGDQRTHGKVSLALGVEGKRRETVLSHSMWQVLLFVAFTGSSNKNKTTYPKPPKKQSATINKKLNGPSSGSWISQKISFEVFGILKGQLHLSMSRPIYTWTIGVPPRRSPVEPLDQFSAKSFDVQKYHDKITTRSLEPP